jgi:5'-methylthioadenosine phosphorylase
MPYNKNLNKVNIAIIGGTGVYDPNLLSNTEKIRIQTPFGTPSDTIMVGDYAGVRVAFLPRHGSNHAYPPHKVPYRANIWALHELGVKRIIAPCAVGSLKEEKKPGQIVIADQFFDFTKGRDYTFYDGGKAVHVSVAEPFCDELRKIAIQSAEKLKLDFHKTGTTVTIQGPRYSTKAESNFFRNAVNADIIGMTLVPECVLARELEICYVSIAAVTDYDVWSNKHVDATAVSHAMKKNIDTIRNLIIDMLPKISTERNQCECPNALKDATH